MSYGQKREMGLFCQGWGMPFILKNKNFWGGGGLKYIIQKCAAEGHSASYANPCGQTKKERRTGDAGLGM